MPLEALAKSAYAAVFLVVAGLTGCANLPGNMPAGQSLEQTIARLGLPTGRYPLPTGERLQYSYEPSGRQVFNLDFDRAGMLVSSRQAMTEAEFAKVLPQVWTAADVERTFGKPALVGGVAFFNGPVWTYRYDDVTFHKLFHVFLDPQGLVQRTQVTDEIMGRGRRAFL